MALRMSRSSVPWSSSVFFGIPSPSVTRKRMLLLLGCQGECWPAAGHAASDCRQPVTRRVVILALFLAAPAGAAAQTVEISPFGGYRFGGDFFERVTNQPVDLDGAPAVGGVLN